MKVILAVPAPVGDARIHAARSANERDSTREDSPAPAVLLQQAGGHPWPVPVESQTRMTGSSSSWM